MHKQATFALADPVFDPDRQMLRGHSWVADKMVTAMLTVNIGME